MFGKNNKGKISLFMENIDNAIYYSNLQFFFASFSVVKRSLVVV